MKLNIKLDRYNQIVWAIIGTGTLALAAMGGIAILVAIAAKILGGGTGVPVMIVEDPANQDGDRNINVEVCAPVRIDDTPYQLITLQVDKIVLKNRALLARRKDGLVSSYSGEVPVGGCGYHTSGSLSATGNVLIRDLRSGEMRLLLAQNALIHALEYPTRPAKPRERDAFPPGGVLYWEITTSDTNGDGVLDGKDDAGAYFSDVDGSNLVRISPSNSRVLGKSYDHQGKRLYLKIARDTDENGALDDEDGTALVEVDVPGRKLVGTVVESEGWQQRARAIEPLNAAR